MFSKLCWLGLVSFLGISFGSRLRDKKMMPSLLRWPCLIARGYCLALWSVWTLLEGYSELGTPRKVGIFK
jgi:hypothetical protein